MKSLQPSHPSRMLSRLLSLFVLALTVVLAGCPTMDDNSSGTSTPSPYSGGGGGGGGGGSGAY